jgi:ATP-dependent protease HslVU (ClpYQ) ATPase subunit
MSMMNIQEMIGNMMPRNKKRKVSIAEARNPTREGRQMIIGR